MLQELPRVGKAPGAMKKQIIRVEPLASYLEKYKAPTSTVTRHGDTIYVTGAPPFEPDTEEICVGPIERQTELVLEATCRDSRIVPGEHPEGQRLRHIGRDVPGG
jgi:enamine deaminase RidA (YjgF/YER057c/UK114 family)